MLLGLLVVVAAQVGNPVPPPDPSVDPTPVVSEGQAPPLPSDAELRALVEKDVAAARAPLRRAARTAPAAGTRALALRLLATWDASTATARICARSLRLDTDALVRRSGAECLGRLGPRLASGHSAAMTAALKDGSLDVVTMSGWALANVGDAGAVKDVAALVSHPDKRVAKLFRGYAERMRERLGLTYELKPGTEPEKKQEGPTAVPPGVALTFPARGIDVAASTGWLGVYGAMAGWVHGPLMLSAHGGEAGAGAGSLAALGLAALGAASLSGYGFARADTLPLAHTVVQMGTFGGVAGYGAGQLVGFAPTSAVASANLALAGTLVGTGIGIAYVETTPPTMGALAAGMTAGVLTGAAAGTLATSYGYPGLEAGLGVMLVTGGAAGAGTTALLSQQDIGLFPVAGAGLGGLLMGGSAALLTTVTESGQPPSERGGWIILSGIALGAAAGGAGGMLLPRESDPLLAGTLKLDPPTLALLPPVRPDGEAAPMAMISGKF